VTPETRHFVRQLYASALPDILASYPRHDPYITDWRMILTREEFIVWQEIRCANLPLVPKLPIDSRFIDFADPVKHIGVQVVGRGRRKQRSSLFLYVKGWKMYRIESWRVFLPLPPMFDEYDSDGNEGDYLDTPEAILEIVKERHYSA